MNWLMPFAVLMVLLAGLPWAQDGQNTSVNLTTGSVQIDSPWAENSKVCILVREWILKGMFLVIFLVFIAGVATISGAAFPEWRNHGSKMIMGSLGAMILYIVGMQALKFLMGTTMCGL